MFQTGFFYVPAHLLSVPVTKAMVKGKVLFPLTTPTAQPKTEGSQGSNLQAGTGAEAREECCLLTRLFLSLTLGYPSHNHLGSPAQQ